MTKQVTDEEWNYVLRTMGEVGALLLRVRALEIVNNVLASICEEGTRTELVIAMLGQYGEPGDENDMVINLARELLEGRG